ncbi:MAG: hypothetical protein HS132_07965 [Planctomycetia bacterium]|nr:hypothetical protein [Planctomycetia bacterium]
MIKYYNSQFDIRRFAFGFYIPEDEANNELSLLPEQIESLVNKYLYELEKLEINNPVEILFDLYTLHLMSFNILLTPDGYPQVKG